MNCLIEFLWDGVSLNQVWSRLCLSSTESPLPWLAFLHVFLGSNLGVYACSINTLPSLSLESLIEQFLIEGEKRGDSSLRFSDSLAFSSASEMSEWNSSGFLSVRLCSSCDCLLSKHSSFLPIIFLRGSWDSHSITFRASSNGVQGLAYGLVSLPIELVNQSIRWEGPRRTDREVKGRAKHNSLCRDGSHLAPTSTPVDVASESGPVLSLTLPGGLSHRPCWEGSILACVSVLLENVWPFPLPCSLLTSRGALPDCFSPLGTQGVTQQNEKQAASQWSLKHPWSVTATQEKEARKGGCLSCISCCSD